MIKRLVILLALILFTPTVWAGRTFNGTGDLITIPAVGNALDITVGPETISFWVYPTSISGSVEQDMVTVWNGSGEFAMGFGMCNGGSAPGFGTFSFAVGNCAGLNPAQGSCGGAVTANKWYNVILAIDPANKYGSAVGFTVHGGSISCTSGTNGHTRTSSNNLVIGGQHITSNFPGIIAEVAVWNDILSPQERITLNTVCPQNVRPTAIVGYFPLYGISGSIKEPDLSGNLFNGILTGTTPAATHAPCKPLLNF